MKKLLALPILILSISACCNCRNEPIITENEKLIVPPHITEAPKQNVSVNIPNKTLPVKSEKISSDKKL